MEGKSLYIRPLIFATEEALKARIANKYMFAIVLSAKVITQNQFLLKFQIFILELQVVE